MNLFYKLKRRVSQKFKPWSSNYWDNRYVGGGNSGDGSYGKLAEFKNRVITGFCEEHDIKSVIELGSGDGHQASLLPKSIQFIGVDVSKKAIEICENKFTGDDSKRFMFFPGKRGFCKKNNLSAPLTLSLDVIYHLLEDQVFEDYMHELFTTSTRFVMIYSSNEETEIEAHHVRHRKFTEYVSKQFPDFELIKQIPNEFARGKKLDESSFADFYIYECNL